VGVWLFARSAPPRRDTLLDGETLSFGVHNVYADLGAERVIAAERNGEQIAIEIKSFDG